MLRVALPVHVEGELNEGAKALFAGAQLFLRLPQLRDVLQNAKLAHSLPRFVPHHVPLAANYSLAAVGADHPVFNVVAWTAAHRSLGGFGHSRSIVRMNEFQPAPMPFRQVDRLHSENAAKLL